jgi:hypothetical protein
MLIDARHKQTDNKRMKIERDKGGDTKKEDKSRNKVTA